jgi:sugar diacid utilization regulator
MSTQADGLAPLSESIASGTGLPDALRAAARALGTSLLVVDEAGAALAVAARSPADERALLTDGPAVLSYELRRGDRTVGRLHLRRRDHAEPPAPAALRVVRTLIAAEVERRGAGERAARAEEDALARGLLAASRRAAEAAIVEAGRLGVDLTGGAAVVVVRMRGITTSEDRDARSVLLVRRAARAAVPQSLATLLDAPVDEARVALVVPAADAEAVRKAAAGVARRLARSERGIRLALGYSRRTVGARRLHRAGREALLAAGLAGAPAHVPRPLGFDQTGTYQLLLPASRSGDAELRSFYRDTVEPLVDHDAARRSGLVATLQSFLECDASFARAARRLGAHPHTVRYRLAQVRDLTGLDASSTSGREQLGLGLKAMRVLAVVAPDPA